MTSFIPSDWGDMAYLAKIAYLTNNSEVSTLLAGSSLAHDYDFVPNSGVGSYGLADTGTIPLDGEDGEWHFDHGYYEATTHRTADFTHKDCKLNAQAFVAYSSDTDSVVISFRGTEGLNFFGHDGDPGDSWEDDHDVVRGGAPTTYVQLLQPLIDAVTSAYGTGVNYILTGHSLGGIIAEDFYHQFKSAGYDVRGFSFDGPGISGASGHDPNFVHFTHSDDYVGRFRIQEHYGVTVVVDNKTIDSLDDEHNKYYFEDSAALGHSSLRGAIADREIIASYVTLQGNLFLNVDGSFSHPDFGRYTMVIGSGQSDQISVDDAFGMKIDGFDGNDVLLGNAVHDFLAGGLGADTIRGGGGSDSISGDAGDDIVEGDSAGDTYSIGVYQGYDIIDDRGGDGVDTLAISTGSAFDHIDMSWFHVDGNDLLIQATDSHGDLALNIRIKDMGAPSGSVETLELYAGNSVFATDFLSLSHFWADHTQPDAPPPPNPLPPSGDPQPTPPSNMGDFTYIGTSGNDAPLLTGGRDVAAGKGGSDALGGNAGDDILLGNSGGDVLNGGSGEDLLIDDRVESDNSLSSDSLDGGDNNDTLVDYGAPTGGADEVAGGSGRDFLLVDLTDRSADWRLSKPGSTIDIHPVDTGLEGTIHVHTDIETIAVLFGSGDDNVDGDSEKDYFDGGDGDDSLNGNGGDDSLIGGIGDDNLRGGTGKDWFDGGADDDSADIDLSALSSDLSFVETDAMSSSGFTFANGTFVKNVEHFEITTGSGDDQLWFGSGDIDVVTNGGDDTVNTDGHGDETAELGSGYDRVVVDYSWATTQVRSQLNSDHVTFWAYVGSSEASNTHHVVAVDAEEVVVKAGSSADHLFGGFGNDTFYGNDGDDQLDGKQGNNTLYGGSGDDNMSSNYGVDWVDGGAGNDKWTFNFFATLADVSFDQAAAASEAGLTLVNGTFAKNVEVAYIGFGAGTNNASFTGHGQNSVILGAGSETADNTVVVDFSWSSEVVGSTYDSGTFTFNAFTGTNQFVNDVYLQAAGFIGRAAKLEIIGGSNNDNIAGFTLDDILRGGAGNDTLDGSDGSDTASYEDGGSAITVHLGLASQQNVGGGLGSDTLISIENLIGSNFGDRFFGNGASNNLMGGVGDDRLEGRGGRDTLNGGEGADRLTGGNGKDVYSYFAASESTGASYDTVVGFDADHDRFDLAENIKAIDAQVTHGKLSNANFDNNLESAIDSDELAKRHAVLFTADSGAHAGETFLIADANGKAGYQAGEDYVFLMQSPADLVTLSAQDFI